jgi:hypothetical protein
MELVIDTKYTLRAQATWGRLPETAVYRSLIDEGELLPLQLADVAERFGLQEGQHAALLLHGDKLGTITIVPLACDAYAANTHTSHGSVAKTADHVLYLDGTRWAHGEYEFLILSAKTTPFRSLNHPPTWHDLAPYVTDEIAVTSDAR